MAIIAVYQLDVITLIDKSTLAKYNTRFNSPSPQAPMRHLSPPLAIFLGSIMISFSPVIVKLTSTPPTIDGVYRMLFAGIILSIISLLQRKPFYTSASALKFIAICSIFLSFYIAFWHQSIDYLGPGIATIIVNLQVFALTTIGIVLFREPVNWKFFLAIPLTILGLYLLVGVHWQLESYQYHRGLFLGGLAVLCYTGYLLLLRKNQTISQTFSIVPFMAQLSLSSALILSVVAKTQGQSFSLGGTENLLLLITYGGCSQATGWLLIAYGIPHTRLSLTGFLLLLQPTLSFIWDILFFHHQTNPLETAGACITLVAIYLGSTGKISKPNTQITRPS